MIGTKKARQVVVCGGWMMVMGLIATAAAASDPWTKPTADELNMKEQAGYPGAPAVILNREEITRDDLHVMQHYERIKVLTEKGKEYANVELRFASSHGDGSYSGDDKNITDIAGRTVHPDGTIVPFTGKPYLKTFEKNSEYSYQARVFTLPDVEVGSIIEYRYATRIADNIYEAPDWFIQDRVFTRNAHFVWYPTTRELSSDDGTISAISWFPILPAGVSVKRTESPSSSHTGNGPQQTYEVLAKDVAPEPNEENMPPMANFTYRVLFYYTPYRTPQEFWKARGKAWSKRFDSFAGPDDHLRTATQTVTAGASTSDAKLQNIYAKVMSLENTDYTRSRGKSEDKAEGLGKLTNASDLLQRGRGDSNQMVELFVGMARAAGFKAYGMLVPDREHRLFTPGWLYFGQFDNMIAIVNVDGKDQYFDPGSRYCPYGQLGWQGTFVQGLRQTESGTDFSQTPGPSYGANKTMRIGDLTANAEGELKGTVTVTYTGEAALAWRQRALRGDEESLRHGLRTSMESMLPKTMEVKVETIEGVAEYDKPLVVKYNVHGTAGTKTSKRWILPADVFVAEESGRFPHEKRETPIYFHYPQAILDAVRIKYPATMSVEASPADAKVPFQNLGSYTLSAKSATNSITVQRSMLFNTVIVPQKDYGDLRTFYSQLESKDKDNIVLKAEAAPAAAAAAPAGN